MLLPVQRLVPLFVVSSAMALVSACGKKEDPPAFGPLPPGGEREIIHRKFQQGPDGAPDAGQASPGEAIR